MSTPAQSVSANYQQFSPQYIFVRGRQLEGTFPGDARTGIWPITAFRIGYGWGIPPEEAWPYNGDASAWPPFETPHVDATAKAYRSGRYQRVRTIDECKTVLTQTLPVLVSIEITDSWFNAPGGRIFAHSPSEAPTGSHSVLLLGYDDSKAEFVFQNSWGVDWGDQGFGHIPYDVFEATWCEGWLGDLTGMPSEPRSGFKERAWGIGEHGGGVFHCRELVGPDEERIAWTFAVEREGIVEVEELFVPPQFRANGYGTRLINSLVELAADRGEPIKIWISYADVEADNLVVIKKLIRPMGLRLGSQRSALGSSRCHCWNRHHTR